MIDGPEDCKRCGEAWVSHEWVTIAGIGDTDGMCLSESGLYALKCPTGGHYYVPDEPPTETTP